MEIEELRDEALRKGLQLIRLSAPVRDTLIDLAEDRRKAADIALHRLIQPTAASNRLASVTALGLAESVGSNGREKVYRLTAAGRAARSAIR